MRLHEIREPARTADARDADKIIVLELALFDELEVKRQHREIAATGDTTSGDRRRVPFSSAP